MARVLAQFLKVRGFICEPPSDSSLADDLLGRFEVPPKEVRGFERSTLQSHRRTAAELLEFPHYEREPSWRVTGCSKGKPPPEWISGGASGARRSLVFSFRRLGPRACATRQAGFAVGADSVGRTYSRRCWEDLSRSRREGLKPVDPRMLRRPPPNGDPLMIHFWALSGAFMRFSVDNAKVTSLPNGDRLWRSSVSHFWSDLVGSSPVFKLVVGVNWC